MPKLRICLTSVVPPAGLQDRRRQSVMLAQLALEGHQTLTRGTRSRLVFAVTSHRRFPTCGHVTFVQGTWAGLSITIVRPSTKVALTHTSAIATRVISVDGSDDILLVLAELHVMPL